MSFLVFLNKTRFKLGRCREKKFLNFYKNMILAGRNALQLSDESQSNP